MPFDIQWKQNTTVVTGDIYMTVSFPGRTSDPETFALASPAGLLETQEILINCKLYLDGLNKDLLLSWSSISTKDNLNGGVEVSSDDGRNWIRFNGTTGNKADSTTWITIPAGAMGSLGEDGILNPYDSATILLRVVVPPSYMTYGILAFNIGVDFDVI